MDDRPSDVGRHHRPRRGRVNGGTAWPVDDGRNHVLVVTRGHPFVRDPFFEVFESNPAIEWSHVEHPAAQLLFNRAAAEHFDCFVLYDMPGITFRNGAPPLFHEPASWFVEGVRELLADGFPLVVLHHGAAAWPAWSEWSEIVGAHFLYQPGESRGQDMPDSGYLLDVSHRITPVTDHPITEGIEPFELVDELYLCPVFEDSVEPLFRSDHDFVDTNFHSAALALQGRLNERDGWSHPPGSNLVGWVKRADRSPLVYLQFGDGPSAHGNENFRQVLANAIAWACSDEARVWAAMPPSGAT